ncbi:MAG: ferrochelatase [Flavobacteriaceae bacterium]|nr:ferrochelatase [Flavobacteriaceae bacterium]
MKGVLLVNLGSPDSPEKKDVKKYLRQFLMDERVIDEPLWLRTLLVKGIILNTRPRKSAKAYKKIWWDEGSPLIVLSNRLLKKVNNLTSVNVSLAMRYGNPSIFDGIKELSEKGITEILLIPLYPQHAMASTETILVLAEKIRKENFSHIEFTNLPAFYNHPDYIRVLSNSIQDHLKGKEWDHLLFSYHGIPERHIRKTDITNSHCKIDGKCCNNSSPAHEFCYRHHCYETTKKVAKYLELKDGSYSSSFQSRLAGQPWLKPYTDKVVENFANNGTKKMAIVTPAFVSDCLETLEEIGMEAKDDFIEKGGEQFHVIPCLNDNDSWVKVLSRWIDEWAVS